VCKATFEKTGECGRQEEYVRAGLRNRFVREEGGMCRGRFEKAGVFARQVVGNLGGK
jgi:hypothetical protein